MAVTMADIAKLRKSTGAGMMDCKNALTESNGDLEAAKEILRKKGQAIAAKRSDREASQGCVLAADVDGFAAIVALKCETDFVATNQGFVDTTKSILNAAMAAKAKTIDEVKALVIDGQTVADLIVENSGRIGEKIELGAYEVVEAPFTTTYIHMGNKLATAVGFNKEADARVARNIAMQVAAMSPIANTREEIAADIVAKELEIGREKAREEGKPEAILDRIAQGRLNKFYQENCLMEQAYEQEPSMTVKAYLESQSAGLVVSSFKRVTLNEE